jgi:hypothetical protein
MRGSTLIAFASRKDRFKCARIYQKRFPSPVNAMRISAPRTLCKLLQAVLVFFQATKYYYKNRRLSTILEGFLSKNICHFSYKKL